MDPSGKELKLEYDLRFSKIEAYRNSVWKLLIKHYFQTRLGNNKRVLDLGTGWGEFINNLEAREKFGMDLNPESEVKLGEDVRFIQQDCSWEWPLPDNSLDIVFTSNFFEHLESKESLLLTLKQAFRCLRPEGKIFCLGPNIKYLNGRYWDFFDHHLPLTHTSLAEGLRLAGFEIDQMTARFLPYTMIQGKQPPLFLIPLYLRLPVFWPIFGKQFFVVAEK